MPAVNLYAGGAGGRRTRDPRSRRRLWLVRHGESIWNASGLVQGQLDPGLSHAGRRQAERCARVIASGPAPESLYSSNLRRATETAIVIASALGLEVRLEPDLRERSLGDAEGRQAAALDAARSGIEGGLVVDADAAPAGGESVRELYARAVGCAERIISSNRRGTVLVCHGGVVRVLLAWLDGIGPDGMPWPEIENGVPVVRSLPSALPCT
jgi:broad specificity phosphatase PhoE